MYDVKSPKAEEFISNDEILDSIDFAKKNKSNRELIKGIIDRAKDAKGLSHREAVLLLECDLIDLNEEMFKLAKEIKQRIYGNRIVMFAPLYLSNYCINVVYTVHIILKINIFTEKNFLKKKLKMK